MLDNLLKAINLVAYDEVEEVTVSVDDLILLRSHIIAQNEEINRLTKAYYALDAKLSLAQLEKPIKLDSYV